MSFTLSTKTIIMQLFVFCLMIAQWVNIYVNIKYLNYILQPSVPIVLCIYTLMANCYGAKAYHKLMALGFFFSAMGDSFLMQNDSLIFFVLGLGSFGIAHVFFTIAFFKNSTFNKKLLYRLSLPLLLCLIGYDIFLYIYLTNQDGFPEDKRIPVIAYMIVITVMTFAASMRNKTSVKSYIVGLIGACVFVGSDSVLSNSIFVPGFSCKLVSLIVMVTYYSAEYLIYVSQMLHYDYLEKQQFKKMSKDDDNNGQFIVRQDYSEYQ